MSQIQEQNTNIIRPAPLVFSGEKLMVVFAGGVEEI